MTTPLLEVRGLHTVFHTEAGAWPAVSGVDLSIQPGEIVGLVGESGSGKSVTGFSIFGLIDPPGEVIAGEVLFKGQDLRGLSEEQMRQLRGNRIAMIFQDPLMTLNPVLRIEEQMLEAIQTHAPVPRAQALQRCVQALEMVGIPAAASRLRSYPHEFSGGMRQRVAIAIAMLNQPELIICDEPTTALDVTIQQQILDLISDLVAERNMALILISHDLGVISQNVDRMLVMYGGSVVESGPTASVFAAMAHPYTRGLLAARPQLAPRTAQPVRLSTIAGTVPELVDLPAGCPFAGRCAFTAQACHHTRPEATLVAQDADGDHLVRCLRPEAMVPAATPAHVVESALPVHSRS